jgi:hypothetical protein
LVVNNEKFENTYGWMGKDGAGLSLSYLDKTYDEIYMG